MKKIIILIVGFCFIATSNAQDKVKISDLEVLHNTSWEGTLMYIDYTSNKETVLQTKMQISIGKNKITTWIQYPVEPKANSKNTVKLKKGGTFFGSEKVLEKIKLEDGSLKITTLYKGKDNYKPAKIYKTYLFSSTDFSVTKEVKYEGSKEKFIRNKQTYKRI